MLEVTFPFTEHATILQGEVTITDSTGQSHLYKAGDSYFIRQGQVIIWDVKDKQVIKSFFNVVEPQGAGDQVPVPENTEARTP